MDNKIWENGGKEPRKERNPKEMKNKIYSNTEIYGGQSRERWRLIEERDR